MKEFLEISKEAKAKPLGSVSQLAVFIDEKAYKYCASAKSGQLLAYNIREVLGKIGAPYDCYLASDYERVKDRYKAVVLLDPYRTQLADQIIADAKEKCFVIDMSNYDITPAALRAFCREREVHLYTEKDAVVFANESYLFVHSCTDEMPEIFLPEGKTCQPRFKCDATRIKHPSFASELYEIF